MRALSSVVCLSLCQLIAGFQAGSPLGSQQQQRRASHVRMGSDATVAKKSAVVEEVKEILADTSLMFCVRSEGITVNDINMLRRKFPESVTMRCLKNTLVKRAVEDFPKFQGGDALLEYSNYWFFCPEDDMRSTVDIWTDYIKETKKVRQLLPHLSRTAQRQAVSAMAAAERSPASSGGHATGSMQAGGQPGKPACQESGVGPVCSFAFSLRRGVRWQPRAAAAFTSAVSLTRPCAGGQRHCWRPLRGRGS